MEYAEGSAIEPLVLKVNAARIGEGVPPIEARIERELANDLGCLDGRRRAVRGPISS